MTGNHDNTTVKAFITAGTVLLVPLFLILAAIIVTTVISFISPGVFGEEIMGTEDCVISWDYSSIDYFGEEYVPIEDHGFETDWENVLVDEARVQFAPFIGKLFFSDTVYAVKGYDDAEVIRLWTDHDDAQVYFVKASLKDAVLAELADVTE